MPIRLNCPECDEVYRLKDDLAGKNFRCKTCNEIIKIPDEAKFPRKDNVVEQDDDGASSTRKPSQRRRPKPEAAAKKGKVARRQSGETRTPLSWGLVGIGALILGWMVFKFSQGLISGFNEARQEAELHRQLGNSITVMEIPDAGPRTELYPIQRYPLPMFPEFGAGQPIPETNVLVQTIQFSPPKDRIFQPAFGMQMRVYTPSGNHAPKSLPLILVAPAGTPLFVGNALDAPDYHAETLPYAEAGAIVILFSLDGGVFDLQSSNEQDVSRAYEVFDRAGAGTVNARTALEFALAKIPAVDPKRIVIAGHSSAGTQSLLFAAHEPRLAAAIAYCPCTDVEALLNGMVKHVQETPLFPGFSDFLKKSSPKTHVAKVNCPIFLFHSFDDTNTPYAESEQYLMWLKEAGKDGLLSEPPAYGGHYKPMVEEGIPRAIVWLKSRGIIPN